MSSNSTISVITVCFNSEAHIADTLQSIDMQTFQDREHIVIDGESTDRTLRVVDQHRRSWRRVISEPDRGIYDAMNKGISLARGDVIGFLNSDDFFADEYVLARVATAFLDSSVSAVYGDLEYVSKDDSAKVLRQWVSGNFSHAALERGWMPPHPTLYVRREAYTRLGGFNTTYQIAADYEYILRLFTDRTLVTAYLPQVMVKMRAGGASNRSLKNILRKTREDYRAMRAHRVGGLWTLLWKNLSKLPQFFTRRPD
ncbi:MAG: glycosyltransferase family 2 protein [Burkholderiales bacterium]|nr:glycosyltransferase family 2 protein [Burkholderiales bacterium]